MGDKFGSFVYCLTVHPAYLEIMDRCPNVIVQAATDDLKGYARDPLDLCRMFPIAAEALERHAGVRLNVDKSAILLPPGIPDPDVNRLPHGAVVQDGHLLMPAGDEHGRPHKIKLKRDGTVVVGAAVGTDAFVMQHTMSVVRQATAKFSALRIVKAQNALLLLSGCLATALGYLLQVTPPRLTGAATQAWDSAVDAERNRIMSDPELGVVPKIGTDLQSLSDQKARLPFKMGGLGHTSAALLSPIAFFAAYTQHAFHERTSAQRHPLLAELQHARMDLDLVLPQIGLELLTAPDKMGLEKPTDKLQRAITRAAHGLAHTRLKDSVARNDCDARVVGNPTDAFLPFLVAPTRDKLVIDHKDYISGMRFYLLLPQLLRTSRHVTVEPPSVPGARDFSYQADVCRHCPGAVCDRHLIHAHACNSSKAKIRDRHDLVKAARTDTVREAGYVDVCVEPRLSTLGAARSTSQRRGDVFFVDNSKHVHFWHVTDDVVVHPLSPTYMNHGEIDNPRYAMEQAVKKKRASYDPAITMLRSAAAVTAGLRKIVFRPCAFTSLGAVSVDSIKFINGAAGLAKLRAELALRQHPRDDGLLPQQLSKRLRFQARAAIQAAILRGNALLAATVGL